MARRRGNGEGSIYRRASGGPWIGSWYDGEGVRRERSTRTRNRSDAERIVRKWTQHAAMVREGLAKPEGGTELDRHAAASIESHLGAFNATKRAEDRTERHVTETATMIRMMADGCCWRALCDINPEDLERLVGRKRAPADGDGKPWSPRTANKYWTAIKTFTHWCVTDGRLAVDPLARIKKPAPTRQRERRILLVDEWRWLRTVTEHGPERMGMTGAVRTLLYETAIITGLRSSELRSLTRANLNLNVARPHIMLEGRSTKNRKTALQYVRADLANELCEHVARSMPGSSVFNMPRREHMAKMIRADLDAARRAWIDNAGDDAAERISREGSDFLRAEDHDGRTFDFHSLRHTCGAWAAMGGASPKALQTLMRHSTITLTLDTYGHLLPDEAAETVHRMPEIEPIMLRLTGTDEDLVLHNRKYAVAPATAGQNRMAPDDSRREHTRMKKPVCPGFPQEKQAFQSGEEGIRTPDDPKAIPDFESGAFNRSATSPDRPVPGRTVATLGPCVLRRNGSHRQPFPPGINAIRADTISPGSAIRPTPTFRHACQPEPGPTIA